ncbi:type II toxin-antitoxin system VapB family antitoxin [Aerophototrophica crusticola]|uniref:Type II toxin-antitoxin system VapB family antitoxin n=1 Tax=Aerophototrophica crusticola TaxID=1709002 RepID=A0A858R957_9PROT|nr:type II toxin-antitoxin system VapB family antitoxin [Rhodospirillaceae bacterium B3]
MGHIQTRADLLAVQLAALTGETAEEAVERALAERIERLGGAPLPHPLGAEQRAERLRRLETICAEAARLPVLDPRGDDEIVGYNDIGAFD